MIGSVRAKDQVEGDRRSKTGAKPVLRHASTVAATGPPRELALTSTSTPFSRPWSIFHRQPLPARLA